MATTLALCLALAACNDGGGEQGVVELGAEDQARATGMLAEYEAARRAGNPEVAEAAADRLRDKYPDSAPAKQLDATLEEVRAAAEAQRESRRLRKLWDYQANAVAGGTQRSATIFSRTVDLGEDAPAATPDAQLVLRDHPAWGRSVYLLFGQVKFDCPKPCTMKIAFDEAPAQSWAGKQADSGKGPALFIEDDRRFEQALAGAKQVRIVLPEGSSRIPALVFEVGGFEPESYAGR